MIGRVVDDPRRRHGINIDDMDVGREPAAATAALMAAVDVHAGAGGGGRPAAGHDGVVDARAIELD